MKHEQTFQANAEGYWQLNFRLPREDVVEYEQAWLAQGALAVSLEDYAEDALAHPERQASAPSTPEPIFAEPSAEGRLPQPADATDPTTLWQDCAMKVLLPHDADLPTLMMNVLLSGASFQATLIEKTWLGSQDWLAKVREAFEPIVLHHFAVLAHWHEAPADKTIIWLDPGQAFGSGSHATTKMMLEWIEQQTFKQKQVIDYGCGSGILAIAAAMQGANTYAYDIDPIAMQVTEANARQNQINPAQCQVLDVEALMQTFAAPKLGADVLLANILLGPLITLAPTFHRLLRSGGCLMMTGILREQVAALQDAYITHGWHNVHVVRERDGWAMVSAIKA